ncbi:hypothetical protein F5Y15DRAFT_361879 [Xylariaceae sp. FL0016]|nr:hypothetical protein F5Y15DRAFT_361879 [Xylariaceae sp. FL0016]
MMSREHHRRRSPESSRRRRKERRDSREQLHNQSQQIEVMNPNYSESHQEPYRGPYRDLFQEPIQEPIQEPYSAQYQERSEPGPSYTRSRAPSSLSTSSSTSSSLLNISAPSRKFGLGQFFFGQAKKHRRRVQKKRSRRFLRFGNSSSSSLGSDLAYGKGYIDRRRSREFSPPRRRRSRKSSSEFERPAPPKRAQTDEEIIELGRKFAEIARQQNVEDLRASGRSRPSQLVGAATALSQFHRTNSGNLSRGIASSRPHRDSSSDDSEWESASEDESSSDDYDAGLVYGSSLNIPSNLSISDHHTTAQSLHASNYDIPLDGKQSVVDPKLFGPVNSLHGYVQTPCGFEKVDRSVVSDSRRRYDPSIAPSESVISEGRPLREVYPVPTSDPARFDAGRGSIVSVQQDSASRSRPAPVPIQQPRPIAPVSNKVFDSVDAESKYQRSSSGSVLAKAAAVGVAGAAIGAALTSTRNDDRDSFNERRNRDEKSSMKHSDVGASDNKNEKRKSRDSHRELRHDKRREKEPLVPRDFEREKRHRDKKEVELARDHEIEKEKRRREKYRDEIGSKRDRDRRKEDYKADQVSNHGAERREEGRPNRSYDPETYKLLEGAGHGRPEGSIDPFQFQVADDAFKTPQYGTPKRPLTPNVVTVDREPDFSKFELTDHEVPTERERRSRKDSYEREHYQARQALETAEHSTAPLAEAAVAAAAAAILAEDRRGRSRGRGGDSSSRNRSRFGDSPPRVRDPIQEDADRSYREANLARKLAEEARQSRSSSPERSVLDKYEKRDSDETPKVEIISPPELEHQEKKKSPYDGPDADVRIDNILQHPNELFRFQVPDVRGLSSRMPVFRARDPSAERERPVLNLVRPTPAATPTLEKQRAREARTSLSRRTTEPETPKSASNRKKDDPDTPKSVPDVILGPRGEIISTPSTPTSKAVSWGENQTKHYVVESPEREEDMYSGTKVIVPAESSSKPRSGLKSNSAWGVIAAAVSGIGAGAAASSISDSAADNEKTRQRVESRERERPRRRSSLQFDDLHDSPPIPGPKPSSPRNSQMPGAFAEDPDFTASIAAGLEGSGFDPNIVIEDAQFHRRDSPPGTNEPFSKTYQGADHGFVIGEVPETPVQEKNIEADDSKGSAKLSKKERKKLEKAAKRESLDKSAIVVLEDPPAEAPRSVPDDEWSVSSSKLSKKEQKKRDKAAKGQAWKPDDVEYGFSPVAEPEREPERNLDPLPTETVATDEWEDMTSKKKKKSKKAIVVQDEKQQEEEDSPKVTIPVDAFQDVQDVQDAKDARPNDKWDTPKMSKRSKRNSGAYDSILPPEISAEEAMKLADAAVVPLPQDDLEMSSKERRKSKRDSGSFDSMATSVPASELSRESTYKIVDSDVGNDWDLPKKSKKKSKHDSGAYNSPSRSAPASEVSVGSSWKTTDPDSFPAQDDVWDLPKKSKKSKRSSLRDSPSQSRAPSEDGEKLTGPSAADDFPPATTGDGLDDWFLPKKSKKDKKKSKRDSSSWDSPSRSEPATPLAEDIVESPKEMANSISDLRSVKTVATEEEWELPSKDKKKKKKSKRDSATYEDSPSRSQSIAPSELSVSSSKRKSKRDSYIESPPRSNAASEIGPDEYSKKSKKEKRRSYPGGFPEDEDFRDEGEPPDRGRDPYKFLDNDVSSVVSDPARAHRSRSTRGRDDDFDAKSIVSAPGGPDRKRSSKSDKDKRSSGSSGLFDRFKASMGIAEEKQGEGSRSRKAEEDKKSSFLDNADTLGAGVGLTDAAVAKAIEESPSQATNANSEKEASIVPTTPERRLSPVPLIDPEIVEREIRPAIDPQYGDLLPLPPSTPGSLLPVLGGDIPPLPETRPGTPEDDRERLLLSSSRPLHSRRKSDQTLRLTKTPSQSAIPIQFRLGQRNAPAPSPAHVKSSPLASPIITASPDQGSSANKSRPRPTSWESTKSFKPLLLVQKASRDSFGSSDRTREEFVYESSQEASPLKIDSHEMDESRAPVVAPASESRELTENQSTPPSRDLELSLSEEDPVMEKRAASSTGSPQLPPMKTANGMASFSPKPDPIESMSKDRSSYLLHSSPLAHKSRDYDVSEGSPTLRSMHEGTILGDTTEDISEENPKGQSAIVAVAGAVVGGVAAAAILDHANRGGLPSKQDDPALASREIEDDITPNASDTAAKDVNSGEPGLKQLEKGKVGEGKSNEIEDLTEDTVAISAPVLESPSHTMGVSEEAAPTAQEVDDFAPVKLSKKDKKKKKKASELEPIGQPGPSNTKPQTSVEKLESNVEPPEFSVNPPITTLSDENREVADSWADLGTLSKKDKKKKKKQQARAIDNEAGDSKPSDPLQPASPVLVMHKDSDEGGFFDASTGQATAEEETDGVGVDAPMVERATTALSETEKKEERQPQVLESETVEQPGSPALEVTREPELKDPSTSWMEKTIVSEEMPQSIAQIPDIVPELAAESIPNMAKKGKKKKKGKKSSLWEDDQTDSGFTTLMQEPLQPVGEVFPENIPGVNREMPAGTLSPSVDLAESHPSAMLPGVDSVAQDQVPTSIKASGEQKIDSADNIQTSDDIAITDSPTPLESKPAESHPDAANQPVTEAPILVDDSGEGNTSHGLQENEPSLDEEFAFTTKKSRKKKGKKPSTWNDEQPPSDTPRAAANPSAEDPLLESNAEPQQEPALENHPATLDETSALPSEGPNDPVPDFGDEFTFASQKSKKKKKGKKGASDPETTKELELDTAHEPEPVTKEHSTEEVQQAGEDLWAPTTSVEPEASETVEADGDVDDQQNASARMEKTLQPENMEASDDKPKELYDVEKAVLQPNSSSGEQQIDLDPVDAARAGPQEGPHAGPASEAMQVKSAQPPAHEAVDDSMTSLDAAPAISSSVPEHLAVDASENTTDWQEESGSKKKGKKNKKKRQSASDSWDIEVPTKPSTAAEEPNEPPVEISKEAATEVDTPGISDDTEMPKREPIEPAGDDFWSDTVSSSKKSKKKGKKNRQAFDLGDEPDAPKLGGDSLSGPQAAGEALQSIPEDQKDLVGEDTWPAAEAMPKASKKKGKKNRQISDAQDLGDFGESSESQVTPVVIEETERGQDPGMPPSLDTEVAADEKAADDKVADEEAAEAEPEVEFTTSKKKSKKDKKKRGSTQLDTLLSEPAADSSELALPSNDTALISPNTASEPSVDPTASSNDTQDEPAPVDDWDDWSSSKKSKKKKKKEQSQPSDDTEKVSTPTQDTTETPPEETIAPEAPAHVQEEAPEPDLAPTGGKKSKKDKKKKRQSVQFADPIKEPLEASAELASEAIASETTPKHEQLPTVTDSTTLLAEETQERDPGAINDPLDSKISVPMNQEDQLADQALPTVESHTGDDTPVEKMPESVHERVPASGEPVMNADDAVLLQSQNEPFESSQAPESAAMDDEFPVFTKKSKKDKKKKKAKDIDSELTSGGKTPTGELETIASISGQTDVDPSMLDTSLAAEAAEVQQSPESAQPILEDDFSEFTKTSKKDKKKKKRDSQIQDDEASVPLAAEHSERPLESITATTDSQDMTTSLSQEIALDASTNEEAHLDRPRSPVHDESTMVSVLETQKSETQPADLGDTPATTQADDPTELSQDDRDSAVEAGKKVSAEALEADILAEEEELAALQAKSKKKKKLSKKDQLRLDELTDRANTRAAEKTSAGAEDIDLQREEDHGMGSTPEPGIISSVEPLSNAQEEVKELEVSETKEPPAESEPTILTSIEDDPAGPLVSGKKAKKDKKKKKRDSQIMGDDLISGQNLDDSLPASGIQTPATEEQIATTEEPIEPIARADNNVASATAVQDVARSPGLETTEPAINIESETVHIKDTDNTSAPSEPTITQPGNTEEPEISEWAPTKKSKKDKKKKKQASMSWDNEIAEPEQEPRPVEAAEPVFASEQAETGTSTPLQSGQDEDSLGFVSTKKKSKKDKKKKANSWEDDTPRDEQIHTITAAEEPFQDVSIHPSTDAASERADQADVSTLKESDTAKEDDPIEFASIKKTKKDKKKKRLSTSWEDELPQADQIQEPAQSTEPAEVKVKEDELEPQPVELTKTETEELEIESQLAGHAEVEGKEVKTESQPAELAEAEVREVEPDLQLAESAKSKEPEHEAEQVDTGVDASAETTQGEDFIDFAPTKKSKKDKKKKKQTTLWEEGVAPATQLPSEDTTVPDASQPPRSTTQVPDITKEEDSTELISTKKSKKDKKKKKTLSWEDEVIPDPEPIQGSDDLPEDPSEGEKVLLEAQSTTENQQSDDDWATRGSSKKSKKDKKNKTRAGTSEPELSIPDPDQPHPEADPQSGSHPADIGTPNVRISETQDPGLAGEIVPVDQTGNQLIPTHAVEGPASEGPESAILAEEGLPNEQPDKVMNKDLVQEPGTEDEPRIREPVATPGTNQLETAEKGIEGPLPTSSLDEQASRMSQEPETIQQEQAPIDDWDLGSNKKSKKDKKKKKRASQADWEPEPEAESESVAKIKDVTEQQPQSEDNPIDDPIQKTEDSPVVEEATGNLDTIENAGETFPEFTSTKKSKKDKKKKRQSQVEFESETTFTPSAEKPQELVQQAETPIGDDMGQITENRISQQEPFVEEIAAQMAEDQLHVEAPDETAKETETTDEAFPEFVPSKKSKKDKKKKRQSQLEVEVEPGNVTQVGEPAVEPLQTQSGAAVEHTFKEPEHVGELTEQLASEQAASELTAADDEFAETSSKKKSTKDKKENRQTQIHIEPESEVTTPPQEPQLLQELEVPQEADTPREAETLPDPEEVSLDTHQLKGEPDIEQPSIAPQDTPLPEDAFPEFSSTKKSKKKKKKASQLDWDTGLVIATPSEPQPEPYPELQADPLEEPDAAPRLASESEKLPDQQLKNLASKGESPETMTVAPEPEDPFPEFTSSNKSKKKKKRGSQLDWEAESGTATPSDPQAATVQELQSTDDIAVQERSEQPEDQLAAEQQPLSQEEDKTDDVFPEFSSSKKSKKKTKKGAQFDWEAESGTTTPAAQPESDLPLGSSARETVHQTSDQPFAEEAVLPKGEDDAADAPAFTSGKISKKEKKKAKKLADTKITEPESLPMPMPEATQILSPVETPQELDRSIDQSDMPSTGVELLEPSSLPQYEQSHPEAAQENAQENIEEITKPTDVSLAAQSEDKDAIMDEAPQEQVDEFPEFSMKKSKKDKKKAKKSQAQTIAAAEPDTQDGSSTDFKTWDWSNIEDSKMAEPADERAAPGESLQVRLGDTSNPINAPEIIDEQDQDPALGSRIEDMGSAAKQPEPELEDFSITRKKSKKDKKKKKGNSQMDSEPASGTQTPLVQDLGLRGELGGIESQTDTPELGAAETQDDEWADFGTKKSKKNKKGKKVSDPSTPMETVASKILEQTIEEPLAQPSLEEISEVEGQTSKAKDVWDDDKFFKPKDSEASEIVASTDPTSRPKTPSATSRRASLSLDLPPAQLTSHVEHDRPFDQSTQPEKKVRTQLPQDDVVMLEPLSATKPKLGLDLVPSGNMAKEPDFGKMVDQEARDIAVSYLESELAHLGSNQLDLVREKNQESGLLPALTPQRELAASYFEGYDSSEKQTNPKDDSQRSSPPGEEGLSVHEAPVTPIRSPSIKVDSKDDSEKQKSPSVDTAALASAAAGGVAAMAEKFGGSKKSKGKKKSKSKYVDKRTSDNDDFFDDPSLWESSERKPLEEGSRMDTDSGDFWNGPSTEEAQTSAVEEKPEIQASRDLVMEDADAESPIVGGEMPHNLPKSQQSQISTLKSHKQEESTFMNDLDTLDTSEPQPVLSTPQTPNFLEFGRSSPRLLPPVAEETGEDLEKEEVRSYKSKGSPDVNRDSGFVTGSPHPFRHSFEDASQRDSGVHMRDWPERGSSSKREDDASLDSKTKRLSWRKAEEDRSGSRTPKADERRSKRSVLGSETPTLGTPRDKTPEGRDDLDPKKSRSAKYQELAETTGPAAALHTPQRQQQQRSVSDNVSREGTPQLESQARRSASNTSISRLRTPEPLRFRPDSPSSHSVHSVHSAHSIYSLRSSGTNTPPLRRIDKRMSGDLRSLSQPIHARTQSGSTPKPSPSPSPNLSKSDKEAAEFAADRRSTQTTTPTANEGRVRAKDMTDVYDGLGEGRIGSPRSPTRPHSMRRRQSMQVLELESKVEQLLAENRALAEARAHAENSLSSRNTSAITERDAEIESLKASLEWLRNEVTRLTEVNEGLHSANNLLAMQHNEKYNSLESRHASAARELEEHRGARGQYTKTLQEKDAEIQELRNQLEATKEQIREMQRQILATKPPDAEFLRLKDEDHFDHRCQQLCSHVQQWVLRFSKFSDMRACRLTSEINDEKIIDRLDNSVLDGTDVDDYLSDRVRRRDIFMSMTMNMIWEFVFTRYLFGMDREQRQKLKSLEKLLTEVGPPHAVRQWRAVTLTLLSKRPAFGDQRNQDTEAVVQAVFQTLSMILPPPSNLESQIQSQLRRVMREAVDLAIEMRTQRAEYMMLPPLQPDYDANGELAQTVTFNASLMNERSGDSITNEELEAQGAVVRSVLFPLVVKKGDDNGLGDDEIVVCPAQVLVAKPDRRTIRMVTPSSEAGGVPLSRGATPSVFGQSNLSVNMTDAPSTTGHSAM